MNSLLLFVVSSATRLDSAIKSGLKVWSLCNGPALSCQTPPPSLWPQRLSNVCVSASWMCVWLWVLPAERGSDGSHGGADRRASAIVLGATVVPDAETPRGMDRRPSRTNTRRCALPCASCTP